MQFLGVFSDNSKKNKSFLNFDKTDKLTDITVFVKQNANIQFSNPPLQMETENPQQQNFQSFDYYGSPNGQTPQNTNQPSGGGGGGGMLMNRLEHDFHETQFPRDEGFRFL